MSKFLKLSLFIFLPIFLFNIYPLSLNSDSISQTEECINYEKNNEIVNTELIYDELPNTYDYYSKYCYIFKIFLIAGIIYKLNAKKK